MKALIILVALCATAVAQPRRPKPPPPPPPPACVPCVKGDAIIDRFGLGVLRAMTPTLQLVSVNDPLSKEQYTTIVELRQKTPVLAKLGAIEEADLEYVAAAMCKTGFGACNIALRRVLRCLSDRCEVSIPDPPGLPAKHCTLREKKKSPRLGLGLGWGDGWQRSHYPVDGHAWTFGLEGRLRVTNKTSIVARIDRSAGTDKGIDQDDNGADDEETNSVTRITALAGPGFILDSTPLEDDVKRMIRLDVLAGYTATRTQQDEGGPAVAVDLAMQLAVAKIGVRAVQGLFGAKEATMAFLHYEVLVGADPEEEPRCQDEDEDDRKRSSRFGLGVSYIVGGAGFAQELGYLAVGMGFEGLWHMSPRLDAVARADVAVFPGYERDRVIHQAVLGGFRFVPKRDRDEEEDEDDWRPDRTSWFATIMGGWTHGADLQPNTTGTGPVVDVSIGWGLHDDEGAASFRLHGRFGASPENIDYRVLMISVGGEIHFDKRPWRDRL